MTLTEALEAFSTALFNLFVALSEEGVEEAPDLGSILQEAVELPGHIIACAALAGEFA